MEVNLNQPNGLSEDFRNLLVGPPLYLSKNHGAAVGFFEFRNQFPDAFFLFAKAKAVSGISLI